MTLEAGGEPELQEELLEHIAAAHEAGMRRDPGEMMVDAYDA